ncbi:hypothetical protein KY335_01505 [Candidatus Woesearchaeota archaeon]|nr:hypothetical protein [Candidatus Woesearchaeota archaeon]
MLKRKISKEKYVIAAFITAAIFFMGFFLGLVVENKRVDLMTDLYQEHTVAFSSSQMQYEYLNEFINNETCDSVFETYYTSLEDLDKTQRRLEDYSKNEKINHKQFDLLKREYLLAEVKFWLLAKKIKDKCDSNMVPLLNFHAPAEECPDCDEQSFVLSYLKKKFGQKLLIFSFNLKDINEPMVNILKLSYNVTELPTIIVDDQKFHGFSIRDDLEPAICSRLIDPIEDCQLLLEKNELAKS